MLARILFRISCKKRRRTTPFYYATRLSVERHRCKAKLISDLENSQTDPASAGLKTRYFRGQDLACRDGCHGKLIGRGKARLYISSDGRGDSGAGMVEPERILLAFALKIQLFIKKPLFERNLFDLNHFRPVAEERFCDEVNLV